jgi:hypothetical protein
MQMYKYQPAKIVELDEAVRARLKAQQRMERASLGLVRDALNRIARAKRPLAAVASTDATMDGRAVQTASHQ